MALTLTDFAIVGITGIAVVIAVVAHYEVSTRLMHYLDARGFDNRKRMLHLIFALIVIHVVQIWMFAGAAQLMLLLPQSGTIEYHADINFFDMVYLSAVTFTTLGFGDITPIGSIRFLYGSESLAGFTLITWSASLTFLEVQRHWQR